MQSIFVPDNARFGTCPPQGYFCHFFIPGCLKSNFAHLYSLHSSVVRVLRKRTVLGKTLFYSSPLLNMWSIYQPFCISTPFFPFESWKSCFTISWDHAFLYQAFHTVHLDFMIYSRTKNDQSINFRNGVFIRLLNKVVREPTVSFRSERFNVCQLNLDCHCRGKGMNCPIHVLIYGSFQST